MKNYRLARINNYRFTVRFIGIAADNNFKTVGAFEKFLNNIHSPNGNVRYRGTSNRKYRLLQEIEEFKVSY
jgi:hypothetical protein